MGLHTGEPAVGDERLRRARRPSRGADRGGRRTAVRCCSRSATRELVEDDELAGSRLRDLGAYRLKDIDRPGAAVPARHRGPAGPSFRRCKAEKVAEPHGRLRRRARPRSVRARPACIAARRRDPDLRLRPGLGGSRRALARVDANSVGLVDSGDGQDRRGGPRRRDAHPHRRRRGRGLGHERRRRHRLADRPGRSGPSSRRSPSAAARAGSRPATARSGSPTASTAPSRGSTRRRNTVVQTIAVGNGPVGIAYAAGSIWVANTGDGTITRIDADSGKPTKTLPIAATELAFGAGTLWASDSDGEPRGAHRSDDREASCRRSRSGTAPPGIAFGSGAAWVANSLDGTVSRIDPATNSVAATIPTGNGPTAVAVERARRLGEQPVRRHAGADRSADEPGRRDAISVGNRPAGRGDLGRQRARERPPVRRGPSRRHADGADEPRHSTRSTPPSPTTRPRGRSCA